MASKNQRAENKAGSMLNRLLTQDVGSKFWEPAALKTYLETILPEAGFKLEGEIRPFNASSGESSIRVSWPGGSDRHWLVIRYTRRPSGHIAATAGLGRS